MKKNFKKILMLGLVGIVLIIASEILGMLPLKILGFVILSVVFVINSNMLAKRIEKLENGKE